MGQVNESTWEFDPTWSQVWLNHACLVCSAAIDLNMLDSEDEDDEEEEEEEMVEDKQIQKVSGIKVRLEAPPTHTHVCAHPYCYFLVAASQSRKLFVKGSSQ